MNNLDNKYASVYFDSARAALSVTFKGFVPHAELITIVEHEFALIRQHKIKKCMIDLREYQVYAPGSKEYIDTVWFPQVIAEGVKRIAIIVPTSIFAQSGMKKAHERAETSNTITVNHFDQPSKAWEWLGTVL